MARLEDIPRGTSVKGILRAAGRFAGGLNRGEQDRGLRPARPVRLRLPRAGGPASTRCRSDGGPSTRELDLTEDE
jgi:hypothetical protein